MYRQPEQAKRLTDAPDEVIGFLDSAIGILENEKHLKLTGIHDIGFQDAGFAPFFSVVTS